MRRNLPPLSVFVSPIRKPEGYTYIESTSLEFVAELKIRGRGMLVRNAPVMRALILSAVFTTLLGFQNCVGKFKSAQEKPAAPVNSRSMGGTGYGGKTEYVNRTLDSNCPDGSNVKGKVEVDTVSGAATVVRENCQDTSKTVTVAEINLLPHNLTNLVYGDRTFDEVSDTLYSELFCRGSTWDSGNQQTYVVDAIVHKSLSSGVYSGRVKLGIYDASGALSKKYDMGEVALGPPISVMPGHRNYNSLTLDKGEVFTLDLTLASMTASLTYAGEIPGPSQMAEGAIGSMYLVRGLHCSTQE